jgi:hypothetical protein
MRSASVQSKAVEVDVVDSDTGVVALVDSGATVEELEVSETIGSDPSQVQAVSEP